MATATVPMISRKQVSPGKLLVNGKWRDALDGATMNTVDPTTEEVITSVAKASAQDADEAVQCAFEVGPWSRMIRVRDLSQYDCWAMLESLAVQFSGEVPSC